MTEAARNINQQKAIDPALSAWVSASAGSGKTTVLTNRVMRLLLEGVAPHKILCLTFTKTAAAEIMQRITDRLGDWAGMDEGALSQAMQSFLGRAATTKETQKARHLFAEVLEAPGGLMVQTIHAFCQYLLQRFPIEANIPPHFRVLSDLEAEEFFQKSMIQYLRNLGSDPQKEKKFLQLLQRKSLAQIQKHLKEFYHERRSFQELSAHYAGLDGLKNAYAKALSLSGCHAPDDMLNDFVQEIEKEKAGLLSLAETLAARQQKTTSEIAEAIFHYFSLATPSEKQQGFTGLWGAFLTKKGEIPQNVLKGEKNQELRGVFVEFAARFAELYQQHQAAQALFQQSLFLDFGFDFLNICDAEKRKHGFLDFDDLIYQTHLLLETSSAAQWVLYKLDGGIDHILIDEAQDTNPEQWQIIRGLADEFYHGAYNDQNPRTVFCVGDFKQSIFSFQRADPEAFQTMRRYFARKIREARLAFDDLELATSFRSGPAILAAVDAVFNQSHAQQGVLLPDPDPKDHVEGLRLLPLRHQAHHEKRQSLVELWPMMGADDAGEADDEIDGEAKEKKKEKEIAWTLPLAPQEEEKPSAKLAQKIAKTIHGWLQEGRMIPSRGRKIRAGDIMVLLRSRDGGRFPKLLIDELKARNISVAGADRLQLTDHIAIQDLLALAKFLLLPSDDLTLAVILKSPFFHFTEDDLFDLAYNRPGTLWQALQDKAPRNERYKAATEWLSMIMKAAPFLTPFEFYHLVLSHQNKRQDFVARLGTECLEIIEEFMSLALAYQKNEAGSLQGFVSWLSENTLEIKRDTALAADEVRIMTVHASKGLEAPIVIMADSGRAPKAPENLTVHLPGGKEGVFYALRKDEMPPLLMQYHEKAAGKIAEEYHRLLYVGMTRASDHLIITGWQGKKSSKIPAWYEAISHAFETILDKEISVQKIETEEGALYRWQEGAEIAENEDHTDSIKTEITPLPAWAQTVIGQNAAASLWRAPKQNLLNDVQSEATEKGNLLHDVLCYWPRLPRDKRLSFAQKRIVEKASSPALAEEALLILQKLYETEMVHDLMDHVIMSEQSFVTKQNGVLKELRLDALLCRDNKDKKEYWILDYKTGTMPPVTPPAYRAQLAAYYKALQPLYPGAKLRCFLLWLETATLVEVPLDDSLDGSGGELPLDEGRQAS